MNSPNPLMPQGTLQQQAKGKSTVRIAIFTIVAIHAVFFSGLLMQGCKRDARQAQKPSETNALGSGSQLTFDPGDSEYSGFGDINRASPVATRTPSTTTEAFANRNNAPLENGSNWMTSATRTPAPERTLPPVSTPAPIKTESREYTIVRGDTLSKIAREHGVSVSAIQSANPGINPNRLQPNQKIVIPPAAAAGAGIGFAEPSVADGPVHVVKPGDTLAGIAKTHGVTVNALKAANNLRTDRILVNQKLKLPSLGNGSTGAAQQSGSNLR